MLSVFACKNQKQKIMKKIFLFLFLSILSNGEIFAQNSSKVLALATADSSYFAVNIKAGWQQFNSYLTSINTDSVMIETIVQHDRTIDLSQEQLIGKIKSNNLLSETEQTLSFKLIDNLYQLRIEPNGKCYLRLSSGSLPDSNPVIIPVRVVYKL
jgi:hypothetical protein